MCAKLDIEAIIVYVETWSFACESESSVLVTRRLGSVVSQTNRQMTTILPTIDNTQYPVENDNI